MNLSIAELAASAPALLNGGLALLKMTCVLVAALAAALALRRAPAGARHLVWLVALAGLLVLPFLAAWGPVPLRVLPASEVAADPPRAAAAAAATAPSPAAAGASLAPAPAPGRAAPPRRAVDGLALAAAAWAAVAAALLVRLALGAWSLRRILRSARPLDTPEWRQPLYEIADRLGLDEAPRLLRSDRVAIPFASGLLRTLIVLPAGCEAWSAERRTAVLIHELGHVRRRDLVGHTLSRIACALYWFHPLVWTAARRLRIESERACDDLALALGARPSEYAEHLLDIVSQVRGPGAPSVALAMARRSEFEGRMLAILDPRLPRRGLGRLRAAGLAGSLAALIVAVGAISPAPRAAARPAAAAAVGSDPPALAAPVAGAPAAAAAPRTTPTAPLAADLEERAEEPAEEAPPADDAIRIEEPARVAAGAGSADARQRVEVLVRTLREDPSPEVRRVAAWGLSRYARLDLAAEGLAEALAADEEEAVREMAAWALGENRGSSSAVSALYAAFRREKHPAVRRTAAWAAGSIGSRALVPGLVELLDDSDPELRELAAWAIGSCNATRAPAALIRLLRDPHPRVRLSAAWALREIEDPAAAEGLEEAFRRERDAEVRFGIIRALGAMGEGAVETLARLVESSDPEVRTVAVTALAGGNAARPWPWPRPEPRPFP